MWDITSILSKINQRSLVEFFHSLPHLNMWFIKSNSTFDPKNSDYLETILFWSTVPILFLIFLLLILILYACCLVCRSHSNSSAIKIHESFGSSKNKRTKIKRFKIFIIFFVILLGVSLGFLIFGSEAFHYSFKNVTSSIQNFSNYFTLVGNQTKKAKDLILTQINTTNEIARHMKDCATQNENKRECAQTDNLNFKTQQSNKLAFESLKELSSIKLSLNESYNSLEILNQIENEKNAYLNLIKQFQVAENTRWGIMIGVASINMILIALLAVGLIRNSKGSLCFFAFAGVLSLISIWVLNALYLGVTVFIADYCISPDQYILNVAERNQIKNLVSYFTTCYSSIGKHSFNNMLLPHSNRYTPFKLELNKAESKLRTAATLYNDNFISMSQSILGERALKKYNFQETIVSIESILDSIRSLIKCDQTSSSYREAVNTLCNNSIFGLTIIVMSSISFGLIMPVLICIIPQMWRRMHTKDYYDYHRGSNGSNGDESHPFLSSNGNANSVVGQIRTNISAARQFNESPSFQRLTTTGNNTSNISSSNMNTSNINSLGRNHSRNRQNSTNQNYSSTLSYNQAKLNRMNEFVVNTDPYLMTGGNGMGPSAPPQNTTQQNVYQSYYTQIATLGRERFQ